MNPPFFMPNSPLFTFYEADLRAFDDFRWSIASEHPEAIVRHVRGARCHSKDSLLNEFAAAFQFPLYFGHNWDALHDMLNDLSWLGGADQQLGILIADADQVLMHAIDHAMPFWELLKDLSAFQVRVVLHIETTQADFTSRRDRLLEALKKAAIVPESHS